MEKQQPSLDQIKMVLDFLKNNVVLLGESFGSVYIRFNHFLQVRESEIKYIKGFLDREGQKINPEIDEWMNKPAYDPYVGPHEEHGVEDPDFSYVAVSECEDTDYMDRKVPITQELLQKIGYGNIEPIFDRGFAFDSNRYMVTLKTQLNKDFHEYVPLFSLESVQIIEKKDK